jgi:hypothetical protein
MIKSWGAAWKLGRGLSCGLRQLTGTAAQRRPPSQSSGAETQQLLYGTRAELHGFTRIFEMPLHGKKAWAERLAEEWVEGNKVARDWGGSPPFSVE